MKKFLKTVLITTLIGYTINANAGFSSSRSFSSSSFRSSPSYSFKSSYSPSSSFKSSYTPSKSYNSTNSYKSTTTSYSNSINKNTVSAKSPTSNTNTNTNITTKNNTINSTRTYTPQNSIKPNSLSINPNVKKVALGTGAGVVAGVAAHKIYNNYNNGANPQKNYTYYGTKTNFNHGQLSSSSFFRNFWLYRTLMSPYYKEDVHHYTSIDKKLTNLNKYDWDFVQQNTNNFLENIKSTQSYLEQSISNCSLKPYQCLSKNENDKDKIKQFLYNVSFYEGLKKSQLGNNYPIPDLKDNVFDSFSYDLHAHQNLIFQINTKVNGDPILAQALKEGFFSGYATGIYIHINNLK